MEAAYISQAVGQLAPEERGPMGQRAQAYLEEFLGDDYQENQSLEDHSKAVREALRKKVGLHHIPCPALVDDA